MPRRLLKRNPDTHKGDYGHVLVVGGSPGLTGAVCLCCRAALRSGCGLVTAGVAGSLNTIFEIKLTEAMSLPLSEEDGFLSIGAFKAVDDFSKKADVLAIGCGAGRKPAAGKLILKVIKEIDKPLVVDADALYAVSFDLNALKRRAGTGIVLTPHAGEFSRLANKSPSAIVKQRKKLAKEFAAEYNLVLVLKGRRTIVTDGAGLYENNTGNPGMATAGSGDVLAGMIAAFIAQGLDIFEAAKFGVYLHGLAGDLAARDKTQNCLIASDIIEYLPEAFKREESRR